MGLRTTVVRRGRRRGSAGILAVIVAGVLVQAAVASAAGADRKRLESGAPLAAPPELSSPASELRVALGRLLSEHVFLTIEQIRAVSANAPDREAATAATEANTTDLQEAIQSIYGDAAGRSFGQLWRAHIGYFMDYARAGERDDAAGRQRALDALADYRDDFSRFLASANPNLTAEGAAELLDLHIDQVVAYEDSDFERAFAIGREAYRHMFHTGDALAQAIVNQFPDRFSGSRLAFSPAVTLWLTLNRLLGEHFVLAAEAMRAGAAGGPEAEAAGRALASNTGDLTRAIVDLYGEPAGSAFERLWQKHIDAYLRYIEASRTGTESAKRTSLGELSRYGAEFGRFMAGANPNLEPSAVEQLISHHTAALVAQVDAFNDKDYRRSYELVREAYAHMFSVGKALAGALSEQFPERFPALPDTDLAPVADRPAGSAPLLVVLIALVGAFSMVMYRRRVGARGSG